MNSAAALSKPPAPLFLLLAAWLIPAATSLGYLSYAAGSSRLGVFMHLALVLGVALCCLLPFTFPSLRRSRILIVLPLATFHSIFLAFDALSLLCFLNWGATPTFELIQVYAGQLGSLFPLFKLQILSAFLIIATLWLTLFFIYLHAASSLFASFNPQPAASSSRPFAQPCVRWRFGILLVIALIFSLYVSNWLAWAVREPIHTMWRLNIQVTAMSADGMTQLSSPLHQARLAALPARGKPASPRNLILITIDAQRSDQMQVYGAPYNDTPFLSSLYRAGKLRRIDSAYSLCTFSICGMIGTLSSSYWHQLDGSSLVLTDVLAHYGYQTHFFLSGDHTHFFGLRQYFGAHIDDYRDGSFVDPAHSNDDRILLPWLRSFAWSPTQPTFLDIHLMSVHELGPRHPEFQQWMPDTDSLSTLLHGISPFQTYRNRYLNGILQVDDILRQIFQVLQQQGVLDRSLVIITADHGEYLGEFGHTGHGHTPYEPVVRIPLLLYDQSNAAYPARALTSQVDIAPTFLYAIGVPIPPDWSGIPLQLPTTRSAVSVASHEASGVVAILNGRKYKYLLYRKSGREELFDLDSPIGENANLINQPPAQQIMAQLRALHTRIIHQNASTPSRP